jgi:CheY-like chemotaxis protein
MVQRVWVKVVGFSSVERHALNTIFRLSQDPKSQREWSYEPWQPDSPTAARLALIDGSNQDAVEVLQEIEVLGGMGIIWVGSISPAKAWQSFQRPLRWSDVLAAMDQYFTHLGGLDVDLSGNSWPASLELTGTLASPERDARRALVADADAEVRFYWRTKFSSFGINHIDEATHHDEAQEFLSPEHFLQPEGYDVVVVDLDLPGGDPWRLIANAGQVRMKLLTHNRMSFAKRVRAKVNGAVALGKPLDLASLNALLGRLY